MVPDSESGLLIRYLVIIVTVSISGMASVGEHRSYSGL